MATAQIDPQFDFKAFQQGIESQKTPENIGLFIIKSANDWLKQANTRPIPRQLFSTLWFEGELCILFADTNLGKSILAVQIGDSISRGIAVPGFTMGSGKQPVLYCDYELSDKQFELRYSNNFQNHYQFDPSFTRLEINLDADIPEGL